MDTTAKHGLTPFFFALLSRQAAGVFANGIHLLLVPGKDISPSLSLLIDLACSSFFSAGPSTIEVLEAEDGPKAFLSPALEKIGNLLRDEGKEISWRFLRKGETLSSKTPIVVYADETLDPAELGLEGDYLAPCTLEGAKAEDIAKEFGRRLGISGAWLDQSFDGKGIAFPERFDLSPRPFHTCGKAWQKAYSALFSYFVEGDLTARGLRAEAEAWLSSFREKSPEDRYASLKETYKKDGPSSSFEKALRDLAEEEHRRWEMRTILHADSSIVIEKAKKGMMVPFDRLVEDYFSSPAAKDIIVYDYLDVLGALDVLFGRHR